MVVTTDSGVVVVSPNADGVRLAKSPTSAKSDECTVTFTDVVVECGDVLEGNCAAGQPAGSGGIGAFCLASWRVRCG